MEKIYNKIEEQSQKIIPLENAKRSPRLANVLGIYFSLAKILASRGKPEKEVLAAIIKIIAVMICTK